MRNGKTKWKSLFLLCIAMLSFMAVSAQSGNKIIVKGHIKDQAGEALIGVSIQEKGNPTNGSITDHEGNFEIQVSDKSILIFSYVGFIPQEVNVSNGVEISITLVEDSEILSEVVVIGYGSVKKDDLTGSVTAIKVDELNKGLTTSPQDLLGGKIAGVSVVSGGGQPGASSTIRIRGGASLSASNDPLIVIDGVIMSNDAVGGLSNGLSTLNPADIETFTVLKDASSTAIYGSRASNGVILITTKKGKSEKIRISYNGNVSVSSARKKIEVLSGDEYRDFINNMPDVTDAMKKALNIYPDQNTNWQDEIYRNAISTDHNISILGALKKKIPYRLSLGYTNNEGIVLTSNFERITSNLSLTPSLFQDHLKVNLNAKGTYVKNQFADVNAVATAVFFDPTKPVYDGNQNYGGYYSWTKDYTPDGALNDQSAFNPLSLLHMVDDQSKVKSFVGNAQFDYKLHFFPDLRLNLNMAYDYSNSKGGKYIAPNAPSEYGADPEKTGSQSHFENTYTNTLFESYALYNKELPSIESRFDAMGGYSYQSYKQEVNNETFYLSRDANRFGEETTTKQAYTEDSKKYILLSFYGRLNYTLKDKYLMTFTMREDASSRFDKNNRWGLFPSLALGWRMSEESFLKNVDVLQNLKLRLGWGVTGQQAVNDNWYPSQRRWRWGQGGVSYPQYDDQGNVTWINVIKPVAANPDLKWEETTTWNVGVDYGLFGGRINGAIDIYLRKTKDLLNAEVNVPAGKDFAELIVANIGDLENKGIEFSINATPIVSKNFTWELGYNISLNRSKITALTFNDAMSASPGKLFESTGKGGKNIKIHSVGHAPGSFYMYEQIYDTNGKPIEGAYVDRNNDGVINDGDKYHCKSPEADLLMGFSSKFIYKDWDFGFNGRVSLGNYVYNFIEVDNGGLDRSNIFGNNNLTNRTYDGLATGFQTKQRLSDHYVQNASFLKIDNITLGYSFKKILNNKIQGRVFGSVQNPIIITKYKGLDPEISNGVDREFYPRPLTFMMGVNLNF